MNAKTLTIASAFVAFLVISGPASAQPAPDAAAPAAAASVNPPTTQIKNPYGFGALVANGDWVSHSVLGLLAIMSFGSWFIFVEPARFQIMPCSGLGGILPIQNSSLPTRTG